MDAYTAASTFKHIRTVTLNRGEASVVTTAGDASAPFRASFSSTTIAPRRPSCTTPKSRRDEDGSVRSLCTTVWSKGHGENGEKTLCYIGEEGGVECGVGADCMVELCLATVHVCDGGKGTGGSMKNG